jgi:large repetitive protein
VWTDGSRLPGATHKYQVAAFDAAGNATPSTPVFATVPAEPAPPPPPPPAPPPADTTAPAVDVVSPGNRTRLRRARVVIAGSASDDDDVDRMEIWIDGRRRAVTSGASIRRTWVVRRVRVGKHKIRLRAVDSSGNAGSRTVRVRVERKARSARRSGHRR